MESYKIYSFILVFVIYLVAMLPTFISFALKKNTLDFKNFIKQLCICTFIETFLFSLIYIFPRNIIKLFSVAKNIENYSLYALKILFIGSLLTLIHYALPLFLFKKEKKKKAIILFSLKLLYIPILSFINSVFNTRIALFTMPILDFIYSVFMFINLYIIRKQI